jgi:alkylated DNA nucleotide flippase Atl1
MKLLTIDIPKSLHRTIEAKGAMSQQNTDKARELQLNKNGNH